MAFLRQATVVTALVLAAMLVLFAVGCSRTVQTQAGSTSPEERPPVTSTQPQATEPAPSLSLSASERKDPDSEMIIAKAEPSGRQALEEMRREHLATAQAGLEDVYFDFDRWAISDRGRKALQSNAAWLRANPDKRLSIQGHCDERGTSAYNMVLGEKRAKAIQRYLMDLGISADRLRTVSYGKERPFCHDAEESCFQQNRRGHLVVEAP